MHRLRLAAALAGKPADRWLLAALILATLAGWWQLRAHAAEGPAMVEVWHGRTLLGSWPLDAAAPVRFRARGDLGESLIVIEHGRVRMADSPCPTHRCVLSGAHRRGGDIIACVPNRIFVLLKGGAAQGSAPLDAVAE